MDNLNYHHLRYFREVAHEGNLTRTAERVNMSQSALSMQIRQLEERLGQPLFDRVGRRLKLTEVGLIALDHADRIFSAGEELLATLQQTRGVRRPLRVGALSTLSRNFQIQFLRPILNEPDVDFVLKSGGADMLYDELRALALDVVLTTEAPHSSEADGLTAHRISEQPIGMHAVPSRLQHRSLEDLLVSEPLIVPTDPAIRSGFESMIARLGVNPRIAANVDDMAMVRLLTRENAGVAIAPAVVLADELRAGLIATAPFNLDLEETFFAVTPARNFPHPVLAGLLGH